MENHAKGCTKLTPELRKALLLEDNTVKNNFDKNEILKLAKRALKDDGRTDDASEFEKRANHCDNDGFINLLTGYFHIKYGNKGYF